MEPLASLITAVATIGGLIVTLLIFMARQRREGEVRRQEAYLQLELAANEVFRFEALYASHLKPFLVEQPHYGVQLPDEALIRSHVYQMLNLFEISARYRRSGFIDGDVFGSWVAWYHELLRSWYFRASWPHIREHYTRELRAIFDEPVAAFDRGSGGDERKRAFYAHVAARFACNATARWFDR